MTPDLASIAHATCVVLGSAWKPGEPSTGPGEKTVKLYGPDSTILILRGPRAGQREENGKLMFSITLRAELAALAGETQLSARIGASKAPGQIAADLERRLLKPHAELVARARDIERDTAAS